MAKERTLNEYRQTKEYKLDVLEKAHKLNDAAKAKLHEFKDVEFDDLETPEEIEKIQEELNKEYKHQAMYMHIAGDPDLMESAKEMIANKIIKHFEDWVFEMVCKEMGNNYMFQSQNYLTEAGYELFEDEWFEFYHEHHGDILYQVKKNLFE